MTTVQKSKRVTSQSIRENAKKDNSPKWEGAATWDADRFSKQFHFAMNFYSLNSTPKDLRPRVIEWATKAGIDKKIIDSFRKVKEWRSTATMGAVAACLLKGMPETHDGFNNGKSSAEWLKSEILKAIEKGKGDIEPATPATQKISGPVLTIQDRVREQAGNMCEELDAAVDLFITDPESFNPKEYKIISLLRNKQAKPAHARNIKNFYSTMYSDLAELTSGKADDQLREAHKHISKKNVKKLLEFLEAINAACDQLTTEAKVLKKPRAAKVKPAEELVKKFKFRTADDSLGIASVPAAQLIGANAAVVYNTKTRKLGFYLAKTSDGLTVKGSSIDNFTEKSIQKTLRKPAEQLKEFKDQTTQRKFETWFEKSVKTTETSLNGRGGEDLIILRVFK